MVFFDTCIWIELCSVKSPSTANEIRQAKEASALLKDCMDKGEKIITCDEQLLEIISSVQKIRMKEFNRNAKVNGNAGCGNVKEYRLQNDFKFTQNLCKSVIQDVMHFSEESAGPCGYSIDDVLAQIHLADINDCIYFEYCQKNNIEFYTFDKDITNLGANSHIHVI